MGREPGIEKKGEFCRCGMTPERDLLNDGLFCPRCGQDIMRCRESCLPWWAYDQRRL